LGVTVQNFRHLGGRADFYILLFGVNVSGMMQFHNGSVKGTASYFFSNLGKSVIETLAMINHVLIF
jgi:hypothetical protein